MSTDSELDEILRKAIDNNQYYDGNLSYMPDNALDEAKTALLAWRDRTVSERTAAARIDELDRLQSHVTSSGYSDWYVESRLRKLGAVGAQPEGGTQ